MKTAVLLASFALLLGCAGAGEAAPRLPAPGSYALQRIERAPDAKLLDAEGAPARLDDFTHGAIAALGFFYGHCADPQGCPVAWSVFEEARREANDDPLLKNRLRLVFVSLDPERDRPAAMRLLRDAENKPGMAVPWDFLTSQSDDALAPLLAAMGQDIAFSRDARGDKSGAINHMLKVFLIDPEGWAREIYTTAFLTPQSLLNDARTLALAHPEASNAERGR